jgi:CHRD domain
MKSRWITPLLAAAIALAVAVALNPDQGTAHSPRQDYGDTPDYGHSPDENSAVANKKRSRTVLSAVMSGRWEVDDAGNQVAADSSARGSAIVQMVSNSVLCFGITVKGVGSEEQPDTPTLTHIHRGPAGTNGPVVLELEAPDSGNPGASSGCASGGPGTLRRIRRNPANYYVNVHSQQFATGALRGQLGRTYYTNSAH